MDLVARRRRPVVVQQDLAVADAVRTKASDDEFEKIAARYFTPEELAELRSFMASSLGSKEKKLKDEITRDLTSYDAMVLDRLYPALANDLEPQLEKDGLIVRSSR